MRNVTDSERNVVWTSDPFSEATKHIAHSSLNFTRDVASCFQQWLHWPWLTTRNLSGRHPGGPLALINVPLTLTINCNRWWTSQFIRPSLNTCCWPHLILANYFASSTLCRINYVARESQLMTSSIVKFLF